MKLIINRKQIPAAKKIASSPKAIGNINISLDVFKKPGEFIESVDFFLSCKVEVTKEELEAIKKYNYENYTFGKSDTTSLKASIQASLDRSSSDILTYLKSGHASELKSHLYGHKLSDLINGIELKFDSVSLAKLAEELLTADCKKFKEMLWSAISFGGSEEIEL